MQQQVVNRLERAVKEAIAEVILEMGPRRLPLLPADHTFQMMAKAAVSVYEAVVEAGWEDE